MSKDLQKLHSLSPWRSVLSNSIPAMIAMIMMLIYNMADLFFVGQTGDTLQVAAVSLATPVFLFFMSFGNVFGIGGTTVCSKAFGAVDTERAKRTSAFCLWSSVIIGIIVSVIVYFNIDSVVHLLGASEEVSEMVKNYIQIISISGPFILISSCMSNLLRAEGKSKQAMMGMMIGNIVNIILDPLFILGFDLGVEGAAIATLIGNLCSGLFFIIFLLKGNTSLSANFKKITFDKFIISSVLFIGIPASLATMLMSISQVVLNSQMTAYGDLAVAGIGVATKVSMITSMLFIGLGQGVQPLLGYCIGSGDYSRYNKILKFSLFFAFSLSTILTLFCYFNLGNLVGGFLSDPKAFDYAFNFSLLRLPTAVLFGMFYVLINALQAMGAAKSSLIVNISRQGIIFIPAVFILGSMLGETGLVLAQPVADVLSFVLVLTLYIISHRKIFKTFKVY